ncbi:MAG: TolC family outer membrane protein [Pseudomonadota bacterium]
MFFSKLYSQRISLSANVICSKFVRIAASLTLCILVPSGGANAEQQALADVLRMAFETNPTIQAERASQRAVDEIKAQAWAAALPQVTGTAAAQRIETESSFIGAIPFPTDAEFEPLSLQADGQLVVFNGLRNVNSIRQARARVKAGGAQLVSVEQDVLLRTATAFFDVVRDDEVYQSNFNNLKVLTRQREEAQLRFDVGEVTRTDVAQADARLAGARAQLANAQAALAISRANLTELIGDVPQTLEKNPKLPQAPKDFDIARQLARNYAPGVIGAKANEVASRRGVAIAKGAFAPEVALTSQYLYTENVTAFTLNDEQFSYGLRATVPIFTGGLNLSRVREAKARHEADKRRVTEAERRAEVRATTAWQQLQASELTISSATAEVNANELALRGVRREAQLGSRTTLDVLNAEQELLRANVNLANAKRDSRVAIFSVLASAGLLTLEAASGTSDVSYESTKADDD